MNKPKKLTVACIQINATSSWESTWKRIKDNHFAKALSAKAKIIVLPEMFLMRSSIKNLRRFSEEHFSSVVNETKSFCQQNKVAVLLGSLPEKDPKHSRKIFNTSILISETGKILAHYRKIHLFDIDLNSSCSIRESRDISRGNEVKTAKVFGVKVGLSICYDLRFPELFRDLSKRKCDLVLIPSNFTAVTGNAHWEVLVRARAIENQIFIVAPNQSGISPSNGVKSYGTSMIVSPWGKVLKKAKSIGEDVLISELDFEEQKKIRAAFPVLKHRRLT